MFFIVFLFKPIVYNLSNQIQYKVMDSTLSSLFSVNLFGVFQIITSQNLLAYPNTTFTVPIQASDSFGTVFNLKVILQPSYIKTIYSCPKMSSQAKCIFSIYEKFDQSSPFLNTKLASIVSFKCIQNILF